MALQVVDWRGVFLLLAGVTIVAAICVYLLVPEQDGGQSGESLREQFAGIGEVFTSRHFWEIAPWAFTAQAAYLSILGLWSGPWLRDVAGYDRMGVANTLMGISLAMIVGYLAFGAVAGQMAQRGVRPMSVAAAGMWLFLVVQLMLVLQWTAVTLPLWLLFGFAGTSCILPYAVLSQRFPARLAGRANTGLNLLVFVAAFASQWVIGVIINLWPQTPEGLFSSDGYRAGFGLILVLQIIAAAWYLRETRKNRSSARVSP